MNVRSSYTDSLHFFGAHTPQELVRRFGSPLYVYNESILRQRCRDLLSLSSHPGFRVNYSAKANTNLRLLSIIHEEGCVADAMSPGELHLNRLAGFAPEELLYVCNNVSDEELRQPVSQGILVSVDSLSQLDRYGRLNPGGKVMVRFNPGIGAGHHKKVITAGKKTKFGITPDKVADVFALLHKHGLTLAGINQHIGSLFMDATGYLDAASFLLSLAETLPDNALDHLEIIDFGGGFGIPYHKYEQQARLDFAELGHALHSLLTDWSQRTGYRGRFYVEPGRYTVAECGIVLGTVHAVKHNGEDCYVGTDLGFNVLARPMLYDAFHDVEIYREGGNPDSSACVQTIVGNICESGDILAKERLLPPMREGDILGILDAGAYGYVMSSTYNQRLRPAEVLIDANGAARCIRRRETLEDLLAGYRDLPDPC